MVEPFKLKELTYIFKTLLPAEFVTMKVIFYIYPTERKLTSGYFNFSQSYFLYIINFKM